MESVNTCGIIDEEVLLYYFPEFKENINIITCNKYIFIDRKKKSTKKDPTRQLQKGRISKMEWFENLDIQQRIEAISTIATDNIQLIKSIKNNIKSLEEKYIKIDEKCCECTSNQEELDLKSCNDMSKSYYSQNWYVSLYPEYPECVHSVIQNLTFLDFKQSEDTISMHEDLVSDSVKFFTTLEKTWEELQKMEYQIQNPPSKSVQKLMNLGFGENFNIEEMMLCGKILCLIEIALNATYSRSMNDKRSFYQKSYVESYQALWNLNKEIMTENLLLNEEILSFLIESIKDRDRAIEYQTENNIFIKNEMNSAKGDEDQTSTDITNNDIITDIMKHVQYFRTQLISLIRPCEDPSGTYEISKCQEQLYEIIDKSRLYKNGQYDEKTRHFARYFYNKLLNKSREVMTDKLIRGECFDLNNNKECSKGNKKGTKSRKRKRNKNKQTTTKEELINQKDISTQELKPADDLIKFQNIFEEEEDKISQAMKSTTESIKMCNDSNSKLQSTEIMKELRSISVNQETRSEHDKEDQYKLDNDMYEEHECVKLNEFETKHAIKNIILKPQNNKQSYLYQKGVTSLSTKGCEKANFIHTNYDSDTESNFESPSQEHETKCKDYPNVSNSSEVVSLKSESKSFDKEMPSKGQRCQMQESSSTRATCPVSNFNCNEKFPISINIEDNNHNLNCQDEWITSTNKNRRGNKNKKPQKDCKNIQKKGKQSKKKSKPIKKQQIKELTSGKESDYKVNDSNLSINLNNIQIQQNNESIIAIPKIEEKRAKFEEDFHPIQENKLNKEEIKIQNDQKIVKEGPPRYNNSKKSTSSKQKEENKQIECINKMTEVLQSSKNEQTLNKKQNKNSPMVFNEELTRNNLTKINDSQKLVNQEESKTVNKEQKHAVLKSNECLEEEKVYVEDKISEFRAKAMQIKSSSPNNSPPSLTKEVSSVNTADYSMYSAQEIEYMMSLTPSEYLKMMHEKLLYQKLSAEIDEETAQITIMVNMIQKYRQSIKDELEYIAIHTFSEDHKDVEAHIFGSVATELALPESDMDIVVTGVNNYGNKQKLQSNITMLFNSILENMNNKVLVKCAKILNTQVPIIKLTFNLSEYYDECNYSGQNTLPYINFDSIDSINPHLKELSVDISISDSFDESSHLGLLQSNFVKEKLQEYPVLRPVCLMLKKLLVKYDLNDPYTGGLGSFSIFVMLYAALYFERTNSNILFQSENTYKARLFAYFLSYYGECFNVESHTLFFPDKQVPIVVPKIISGFDASSFKKTLCVYDPTNSKNNTTQKAFRIEEIQKLFKSTKDKITNDYAEILRHKSTKSKILFS